MTLDQALERIADLEAENALLREEIESRFVSAFDQRLSAKYGITRQQGEIIALLQVAYPRPLLFWALADSLPHRRSDRVHDAYFVKTQVCNIRKAMGADAIDTVRNRGYALTQKGLEMVKALA